MVQKNKKDAGIKTDSEHIHNFTFQHDESLGGKSV